VTLATRKPAEKTTMSERIPFESPVKLQVGAEHTLRTVNSVQGASEVLIGLAACPARPVLPIGARSGRGSDRRKATAEEAREAFAALAAHAGVIVE
jgi:hypothetical protein